MLETVWRKGDTLHYWWEGKLIQPLWKMVWRVLKKLGIKPSYDPEIPLLGIYPEEIKIEKEFIAALFMIARTWKQPRCPSTNEWIKKSESETKSCSVLSLCDLMEFHTVHGIL